VKQWPRVRGPAASSGVWLRATELEIYAALWAYLVSERLILLRPLYVRARVCVCTERDVGLVTDERLMLNHLNLMLSDGDYFDDSDDDDDDDDDGLSLLAYMM